MTANPLTPPPRFDCGQGFTGLFFFYLLLHTCFNALFLLDSLNKHIIHIIPKTFLHKATSYPGKQLRSVIINHIKSLSQPNLRCPSRWRYCIFGYQKDVRVSAHNKKNYLARFGVKLKPNCKTKLFCLYWLSLFFYDIFRTASNSDVMVAVNLD